MSQEDRFSASRRRWIQASAGVLIGVVPGSLLGQSPAAEKLKIGLVGSGRLGGTVGSLWVKAGHPVLFSSRHPETLKDMVSELGPLARAGTPQEAASFGDVVMIAVPYGALQVGRDLAPALKDKVVLDACNAVASRDGAIVEEVKADGIGITSQKYFPGARLVRAFNTLGSAVLKREANRPEPKLAIPLAGDDPAALKIAADLVRDAGFEPVIVGALSRANDFAMGAPGYGQHTAADLKRTLGVE